MFGSLGLREHVELGDFAGDPKRQFGRFSKRKFVRCDRLYRPNSALDEMHHLRFSRASLMTLASETKQERA